MQGSQHIITAQKAKDKAGRNADLKEPRERRVGRHPQRVCKNHDTYDDTSAKEAPPKNVSRDI